MQLDPEFLRQALKSERALDPAPQEAFSVCLPGGGVPLDAFPRPHGVKPRAAAVLMALFGAPDPRLLLTYRARHLPHHAGQISFPGGAREPQDTTLVDTALRETHEELGIARDCFEVLGELAPVYVPPSNFLVTPFVALGAGEPGYVCDPREVDRVIEAPLRHFLDDACIARETWDLRGQSYDVPFYRFEEHAIWGATARMIAMLVELVRGA